ncbi:hypothetical protein RIR_e57911_A0A2I1GHC4_9GLOM [Rhizophagus irregularis DAOM 181602=DAOM 197198]|uniref:Uncharacterized protein n=2 Tax=Rhizophagus irregularis TaxID=588596 RepID=A0A2I1GHC4_9GLOM|nr:hypothetical protein RhiirA4_180949 [Rhizophagus irregularis]GET62831.1 hypothetical protein RIR_e57911_A0A2I1GHC4_9GLOM [Rhizophagus irregularis DAOM 181602=DAOM 197198]
MQELKFTSKEMNMLYNNGRIFYIFYFLYIYICILVKTRKKIEKRMQRLPSWPCIYIPS